MAGLVYRGAPWASLIVVPLDGLTLVYHRMSGMTHVLAPPAPEILAVLGRGACALPELTARLAGDYELLDGDEAALIARLDELIDAGLVATA